MLLFSFELGFFIKGLESVFIEKVSIFLFGESLLMGSIFEEVMGSFVGCFVGREELEKIILFVQGFELVVEMLDVKVEDEVDFRVSLIFEEVVVGSIVVILKMK